MYKLNDTLSPVISQLNHQKRLTDYRNPRVAKKQKRTGNICIALDKWVHRLLESDCTDSEFVELMKTLRPSDRKILSLLITFNARGLPLFMAQNYIANKTGLSRPYVNQRMQHLRAINALDIYNRNENGEPISNVYKLNRLFFKKSLWDKMLFIPAIRSMFLMFLLVNPIMSPIPPHVGIRDQKGKLTLLIKDEILRNIRYSTDTSNVDKKRWNPSMAYQEKSINGSSKVYSARPSSSDELKSKQTQLLRYQETKRVELQLKGQLAKIEAERDNKEAQYKIDLANKKLKALGWI